MKAGLGHFPDWPQVRSEKPDHLEEACAVFGVYAPGEDVARLTCFGLQALQHRGQESAGIAVGDGETILIHKDLGLVDQVFNEEALTHLKGAVAIGHTRYSTAGGGGWKEAQPHVSAIDDVLIALAKAEEKLGNTRKAIEALENAFELDPNVATLRQDRKSVV